jgi:hypothetical protein
MIDLRDDICPFFDELAERIPHGGSSCWWVQR